MKMRQLGSLSVSEIGMGCMGFSHDYGKIPSEDYSIEAIRKALDYGCNFLDTSEAYGSYMMQTGHNEKIVGKGIKGRRKDIVLATKMFIGIGEVMRGGSAYDALRKHLEASLKRLQTDYVDLYYLHRINQTPIYDILEGLNAVVKAGKAYYIGISNCYAWQLAKANALAEKEGFTKFVSVQGHYNLIFREEEREMAPFCYEDNIAMTPYSALASGRLAKKPGEDSKRMQEDSYAKFKYDATKEQDGVIIGRVKEIVEKHGVTMTEVSLAWLLTKVISLVVGATKFYHIEDEVKAVELKPIEDKIAYLEETYVPHVLAGVMAQNELANAKEWGNEIKQQFLLDEKKGVVLTWG
ncbi:MAG: aldo/keto reductase [Lachnospiraceae bacterium]|nr:aldo/keto reductase [Lachnospiraceae bacterium]